jgi:hypothetical protein
MNIGQQQGEPERAEGLGGRVRRFIDSELNRARDKRDRETDEGHSEHRHAHDPTADSTRHQEAVNRNIEEPKNADEFNNIGEPTYTGESGNVVHPAATAPVESGYDATGHDPREQSTRVESAAPAPDHSRTSTEAAADGSATRVGLLNDPAGLREQWQQVQGTFVDDPQRAVHEASVLVERTLQEIHDNVSRGQISDPTSTEDLRVSFQRYREFFQRLLSA